MFTDKSYFSSESAFFPRMKYLRTNKTSNGSNFGWLMRQMSINQINQSIVLVSCVPGVFSPAAAILESEKTLGTRLVHVLVTERSLQAEI